MTRSVLIVLALTLAGSSSPSGAGLDLGVAGRINANPSLAASGQLVVAAWGAAGPSATDVFVAVSRDAGRTFAAPVRVSDSRTNAALSGEQPPQVTVTARVGREASIAVLWTAKGTATTRLVVARSDDGGRVFTAPAVLSASDAPGNRGWESMAAGADGRAVAIWLDHRDAADGASAGAAAGHAGHDMPAHAAASASKGDATERAQLSKLFFARLDDPASARSVASGVCYCCKTALTVGTDGLIYAAWRHVYPGTRRDIAFAMSRDGGRSFTMPVRVSEDDWQIDGCPENGPALVVDASSRIHVVWPTLVEESGRQTLALFYATSRDGRTFTRRLRLPTAGAAYHPRVSLTPRGELTVAWEEAVSGAARRVRLARGVPSADGIMTFKPWDAATVREGTYPVLAETTDGTLAVWVARTGSTSRIAVARLK